MNFLILGRGKTGSLVAQVARERGHEVTLLGAADNARIAAEPLLPQVVADDDHALWRARPVFIIQKSAPALHVHEFVSALLVLAQPCSPGFRA